MSTLSGIRIQSLPTQYTAPQIVGTMFMPLDPASGGVTGKAAISDVTTFIGSTAGLALANSASIASATAATANTLAQRDGSGGLTVGGLTSSGVTLSAPMTVSSGGTGTASLAIRGVMMGNGTSAVALSGAGTAGQAFLSGGAGVNGAYGNIANTNVTGLGTMSTQNANNVNITGGSITGQPTPINPTDVAIMSYVQSLLQDWDIKNPVAVATTGALAFSPSYSNGSSGVGATLTGSIGVLVIDGYTPAVNDRILVKNQASTLQNGIYTLTTLGTISVGYVLTRATDFNSTATILYGDTAGVLNGTANANQQFTMNNNNAITVGTTAITFAQTSGGSQLTAGSGITITGNTIAANVTTVAGRTGAVVIASGDVSGLASSATTDTTNASNISSGTLPFARLPALYRPPNAQTGTTYTLVIGDAGKHVALSNASAITLTVPTNASVAFIVGTEIDISQQGAGKVTVAAAGGVTINSDSGNLSLATQYVGGTLKKTDTDTWTLYGKLIA